MRYAAFISYSSVDRAMGERVQKALESFVVPASLRGQDFGRGPVPKRIAPIFRDRSDADASADLGATLSAALKASDALIVLCSPAAARSKWVSEEIREFKRSGRWNRIYPAIIDGLPSRFDAQSNPRGAFPPALFECWQELVLLPDSADPEPLAPDARLEGDGLPYTVLKLVSALTSIPLTTLTQRQAETERRERNTARWIAGAMALLAVGALGGGWASWLSSVEARTRLENAVEMAARRVDDAASFHDRYGVPSDVIHELLTGAQKDFDELTQDAPATPMLGLQRARLTRLFAQLYEAGGDNAQHLMMAQRALFDIKTVPTERVLDAPNTWLATLPSSRSVETERVLGLTALGQALAAQGDVSGARIATESAMRAAKILVSTHGDTPARMLLANAYADLAQLDYEAGSLETSLQEQREASKVLTSGPSAAEVAIPLAKLQSDQAEILLELAQHPLALAQQKMAIETLEKNRQPTPNFQRAMAVMIARRGDMRLAAERDLTGARADYLSARSHFSQLLAQDPARTDIKRDFSLAYERAGDAWLQANEINTAAEAFNACLTLRRELVAHDPTNSEWRRDLSVALERAGEIASLMEQNKDAFAYLAEARDMRITAHNINGDGTVATRDLAIIWMKLGKAHALARSPLSNIEAAYSQALPLLLQLVKNAPPESRWRRDLMLVYAERGEARRLAGMRVPACSDLTIALDIITRLRELAADDRQIEEDEAWLKKRWKPACLFQPRTPSLAY